MKQRQRSDCVIASVAMATGLSYAKVKKVCGTTRGGLAVHEIEWLLRQFGLWRRSIPSKEVTASQWAAKHPDCRAVMLLMTVAVAWSDKIHMVAAVDGKAIDPGDGGSDPLGWVERVYILE